MDKQATARPGWAAWQTHPAEKCGTYTLNERARIAADLKRNEAKNSGVLKRDEIEAAHRREVAEGGAA